ncbi:hypothetical protein HGA91_04040 [candidate division WWE3 bacterium]|nr:hypothetical protein [candidate division WWE3 bacterium]
MQIKVDTQKNGTVVISATASVDEAIAARDQVVAKYAPQMKIQGFRPGKAPKALIEKSVKTDKLAEETLSILATQGYNQAIIENKLNPITQPSVSIPAAKDAQTTEDSLKVIWPKAIEEGIEIEILTFINPEISLEGWEKAVTSAKSEPAIEVAKDIKEAKEKGKKNKKDSENVEEPAPELTPEQKDQYLEDNILNALVTEVKFELPDALVRGETDHLLMHHIETIQKLGISYQDFLNSQQKTIEDVHNELTVEAEKNLRIRFILGEIAKERRDFFADNATLRDVMNYLRQLAKGEKPSPVEKDNTSDKSEPHVHDEQEHHHDHNHQH